MLATKPNESDGPDHEPIRPIWNGLIMFLYARKKQENVMLR